MPEEDNKILKYNYGVQSTKVPFIIYADLESSLEKMNTCHNNPEKSSTTKINEHTPSGYSLFTHCSFDTTDFRENATKIINHEKKEMIPLTKEEKKMHNEQKVSIYVKKDLVLTTTKKIL